MTKKENEKLKTNERHRRSDNKLQNCEKVDTEVDSSNKRENRVGKSDEKPDGKWAPAESQPASHSASSSTIFKIKY